MDAPLYDLLVINGAAKPDVGDELEGGRVVEVCEAVDNDERPLASYRLLCELPASEISYPLSIKECLEADLSMVDISGFTSMRDVMDILYVFKNLTGYASGKAVPAEAHVYTAIET